jgi:hypothetical protein
VTIGLEYRVFDPAAEAAKLTAEEIAATGPDSLFNQADTDRGVCLHVFWMPVSQPGSIPLSGSPPGGNQGKSYITLYRAVNRCQRCRATLASLEPGTRRGRRA